MLQFMHEDFIHKYPPLYTARHSFIQLSELEECRVNKLFDTVAHDSYRHKDCETQQFSSSESYHACVGITSSKKYLFSQATTRL